LKLNKYKFYIVMALWMSVTSGAYAIDLYVNTKTKQIFTEPGPDRERIGTFERVEDRPVRAATPVILPPRNESAELKTRAETARLISKVDSLEREVKKSNNVKVKLDKKGLQAESADGNFKLKIGGRMHADASVSGNDKF
jgi:phosphate-selective porin OprO/OprP